MSHSTNKKPSDAKAGNKSDETSLDQALSTAAEYCEAALMANPSLTRRAFSDGSSKSAVSTGDNVAGAAVAAAGAAVAAAGVAVAANMHTQRDSKESAAEE